MNALESNGYRNIVGLKRNFAIEVDDYDEKEKLLDDIFIKSRVGNTELFSLDINLVKQLLASFDGKMIYPPTETKKELFEEANEVRESALIPDGEYTLRQKIKGTANYGFLLKLGYSLNNDIKMVLEIVSFLFC